MKIIYLSLVLIFLVFFSLNAQVPKRFNYQAICRDNGGNIITNQAITLRMTILDSIPGGIVLYQETHSLNTDNFGLANVAVGSGTLVSGNFATITWGVNDKYLQVELDMGLGFISMGTTQLLSVPYAFVADSALHSVGNGGNKIAINTTTTTVSGTIAETQLFSVPIPGGILEGNNAIKFRIIGSNANVTNGAYLYIRLKYGSYTIGTLSIGSGGIQSIPFVIEGEIIANGTTNSQKGHLRMSSGNSFPPFNSVGHIGDAYGTASENSSILNNLAITAQGSSVTDFNITVEAIIVEKIN